MFGQIEMVIYLLMFTGRSKQKQVESKMQQDAIDRLKLRYYDAMQSPDSISFSVREKLKQDMIDLAKSGDQWAQSVTPAFLWNENAAPPPRPNIQNFSQVGDYIDYLTQQARNTKLPLL
jgi:hypothetical protein